MIDLRHGDCLEVMKSIADGSVDLILTDMPYGTTNCKWDTVIDLESFWIEADRICRHNAAMVFTAAQPFTTTLINSNIKDFRYDLVWCKSKSSGFLNANRMPMRSHEDVLIFYKKLPTYNPQKTDGSPYKRKSSKKQRCGLYNAHLDTDSSSENGDRHPFSYQVFKNGNNGSVHPTQKPVELMEWLVKTYSDEHDVVIDMFMGSGSTGVACINTNRKFIGIELDPDYFKIAENRINKAAENSGFLMPKF